VESPASSSKLNETEKLEHDEAIQEIRSWVQTEGVSPEGAERNSAQNGRGHQSPRHFRSILEEEQERLLKESVGLKESQAQLRKALEKAQAEVAEKEKAVRESEALKTQKEKEVQELQTLVAHAEEKYELLREEFRQTRQYFEEKLSSQDQQTQEFLKQIEERDLSQKEILQEKQALLKSFHAVKSDFQRAKDEQEQLRREWESQASQFRRELENQKTVVEGLHAKIQNVEEGKKIVQLSETRLIQELDLQTQQAKRWEQKASELEKEIRRLRESFEDQQKSWQLRLAELEAREMDLENARKQIRELHVELDQREAAQKKTQIHEQLAARETRLKHVVKHQEKIEAEIREREEEMRKLLEEQETIEREVIEAKQAQRHLAEKSKREGSPGESRKPAGSVDAPEFHSSRARPEVTDD